MSKKKILYCLSIFLLFGMTFTNLNVKAHNPSAMSLTYIWPSDQLRVEITHNVADPNNHYIMTVTIRVNGSIVNTTLYTSQPSTSTFMYVYNIHAEIGATIQVNAYCNQGGSIQRSMTLDGQDGQDGEPVIPGFLGLILIITISVFILGVLIHKRKKFG